MFELAFCLVGPNPGNGTVVLTRNLCSSSLATVDSIVGNLSCWYGFEQAGTMGLLGTKAHICPISWLQANTFSARILSWVQGEFKWVQRQRENSQVITAGTLVVSGKTHYRSAGPQWKLKNPHTQRIKQLKLKMRKQCGHGSGLVDYSLTRLHMYLWLFCRLWIPAGKQTVCYPQALRLRPIGMRGWGADSPPRLLSRMFTSWSPLFGQLLQRASPLQVGHNFQVSRNRNYSFSTSPKNSVSKTNLSGSS